MFENDYTINGKHATYLKFLAAKNSGAKDADETSPTAARIFERYIDVYMNAAIGGAIRILLGNKLASPTTKASPMSNIGSISA